MANVSKLNKSKQYDVYLASPWFSPEQEERRKHVYDTLVSNGYKVFSPKDDNFLSDPDADMDWRERAFRNNVEAINHCACVLGITDGKDMGTLFEVGFSYANKIPLVLYAETLGDNEYNLMLAQAGTLIITNRHDLNESLKGGVPTKVDGKYTMSKLSSAVLGLESFDYVGKVE